MTVNPAAPDGLWTAIELRNLPLAERERILAEAADLAEDIYRSDSRLTDFEAFGEDDLHGESSAAPAG